MRHVNSNHSREQRQLARLTNNNMCVGVVEKQLVLFSQLRARIWNFSGPEGFGRSLRSQAHHFVVVKSNCTMAARPTRSSAAKTTRTRRDCGVFIRAFVCVFVVF